MNNSLWKIQYLIGSVLKLARLLLTILQRKRPVRVALRGQVAAQVPCRLVAWRKCDVLQEAEWKVGLNK